MNSSTAGAEPRRTFLEALAQQVVGVWPRGRRLVAVDGEDAARAAELADDLAVALRSQGQVVVRRSAGEVDDGGANLRALLVGPFRAGARLDPTDPDGDAVLVVDGTGLLGESLRGLWHFSVWTLAGDELPHAGATENVDLTDPDAPRQHVYDYCALPPSVGERQRGTTGAGR